MAETVSEEGTLSGEGNGSEEANASPETGPSLVLALDLPAPRSHLGPVAELAQSTGWPVHLLHAAGPDGSAAGGDEFARSRDLADEFEQLDEQAHLLRRQGIAAEAHVLLGPTLEVIVDNARQWNAGMIVVVGQTHRLPHRWVLGSVASSLLKISPIPVLMIPDDAAVADADHPGPSAGLDAAVDRLVEIIERENRPAELEPLRAAAQEQLRGPSRGNNIDTAAFVEPTEVVGTTEPDESAERQRVGARLRDAIREFELDHPSLTRAVNDVAYYLSGMGI